MNRTALIAWLKEKLEAGLSPSFLNIIDDSAKHIGHEGGKSGAGHFTIEISSQSFKNQPLITCHRMIYALIEEAIPHPIHAVKINIKKV